MFNHSVAAKSFRDVLYGGVDPYHINDGGLECFNETTLSYRFCESLVVIFLGILELKRGLRMFEKAEPIVLNTKRILGSQRRTFLLVILTLTFGIEIGFKLVNKQVIKFILYEVLVNFYL
jgi:hypothetical protein